MADDLTIVPEGGSHRITFEGRTVWTSYPSGTPEEMRARAVERQDRLQHAAWRARLLVALADHREAEIAAQAVQKAEQRKARAAATRAARPDWAKVKR